MDKVLDLKYNEEAKSRYDIRLAMEEASRCLLCIDAPCSEACPAKTNPGDFIRSIRFRNVKGAAETIRTNNIFGGSCALLCPRKSLCEEACSRTGIDKPIDIGGLQAFAVEQEKIFGMDILEIPEEKNGKKVVCIGAGPASLACGVELLKLGYEVTVLEQKEDIGGPITYSINPSRYYNDLVEYDKDIIKNLGLDIKYNTYVKSEDIKDLLNEYDAIHIGVGLDKGRVPTDEGIDMDLDGVKIAVELLEEIKRADGKYELGENVTVIGGGDVAMDAAITAKQLGANVEIVYRRTIAESPASIEELEILNKMGISIVPEFSPVETIAEDGKLKAVKYESRDGYSTMTKLTDTLVFAIGQVIPDDYQDVDIVDGIFASGDYKNGGATIVHAIEDGKNVAYRIDEYLKEEK